MNQPKLCKDCKFHKIENSTAFCYQTEVRRKYDGFADVCRSQRCYSGLCGEKGILFQEKLPLKQRLSEWVNEFFRQKRTCFQCKHKATQFNGHLCKHPNNTEINPVDGKKSYDRCIMLVEVTEFSRNPAGCILFERKRSILDLFRKKK